MIHHVVRLLLLSILAMLTACSSLPPQLASDQASVISDYAQWSQMGENAEGHVRLGGVIAQVTNLSDRTRIEIVNLPIDSLGRPNLSHEPQGRFVGYVDGFLDPVTFGPGRLISVIGTTDPLERGSVGEYDYLFPVMNIHGYYLWRVEERIIVDDMGPYLFPCRNFHCRHMDDYPRSGRVIQEVK
ncbi:Slp family lipoprotein [Vibrio cincinnatiensis]|uniref:Slp family lipoprotein n=1 Tax=Vibrio cincinnatiensis TaxID=675 RepID=UPI001EE04A88|nr:Slp family lipoprotein [Vibrio cincinnatiensis]MCG3759985.1 Slp family lipoprotein [Vibrio cincinnatiensis]MCG3763272.1 Slp family lipoprotein [Vibrio cincinnatiensis]